MPISVEVKYDVVESDGSRVGVSATYLRGMQKRLLDRHCDILSDDRRVLDAILSDICHQMESLAKQSGASDTP